MKNKTKKLVVCITAGVFLFSFFAAFATPTFAQDPDPCHFSNLEKSAGSRIKCAFMVTARNAKLAAQGQTEFDDASFLKFFGAYINGIFGFIGLVYLIWIILGGWWWMTAAGNEERILKAKKTLLHSSVGLGIILFAAVITNIVLSIIDSSLAP